MRLRNLLILTKENVRKHIVRFVISVVILTLLLSICGIYWTVYVGGVEGIKKNIEKEYAELGDELCVSLFEMSESNYETLLKVFDSYYNDGYKLADSVQAEDRVAGVNGYSLDRSYELNVAFNTPYKVLLEGEEFIDTAESKVWLSVSRRNALRSLGKEFKSGDSLDIRFKSGKEMTFTIAAIIGGEKDYISSKFAFSQNMDMGYIDVSISPKEVSFDRISPSGVAKELMKVSPKTIVISKYDPIIETFEENKSKAFLLAGFLTVVMLGVGIALIGNFIAVNTYQNEKFSAMLKVLGIKSKDLFLINIFEYALMLILSSLVGGAITYCFKSALKPLIYNMWLETIARCVYQTINTVFVWYIPLISFLLFFTAAAIYVALLSVKFRKTRIANKLR